ncbi:MAG: thiol:disulfide interchange protein DsbA/DsbL [Helicobacteraceae bacterium]|nr:thiol:disulfide interchange protein DsbA/DsbL [Helicobacteraceae bacterium]
MFRILITGFFSLLFSSVLFAQTLVEGRDYVELKNPLNVPKNSVVELFNVGCPHCASIARILPNLFAILPDGVEFLPYHIITGAPYSAQASQVLAVALAKDIESNISPKDSKSAFKQVLDVYFNAFFKERKNFKSADEFIALGLAKMGITKEAYQNILKGDEAQGLLKTWQDSTQYAQIQGTPTFIISGKYLILAQGLKSEEDFIFKVDYLLNK